MSLANSKIRKIVLVEHEGLRISLNAVGALLDQVGAGNKEAAQSAKTQLNELLTTFLRHIEHEERILEPVLAEVDAWGPQRKKAMDEEHALQRAQITRLASLDPLADPKRWVSEVKAFTSELLVDMADEEKTCLSPNVLRDDVVVVDGSSE